VVHTANRTEVTAVRTPPAHLHQKHVAKFGAGGENGGIGGSSVKVVNGLPSYSGGSVPPGGK